MVPRVGRTVVCAARKPGQPEGPVGVDGPFGWLASVAKRGEPRTVAVEQPDPVVRAPHVARATQVDARGSAATGAGVDLHGGARSERVPRQGERGARPVLQLPAGDV